MATYAVLSSPQDHAGPFSSLPLPRNSNSTSRNSRPKLSLNTSVNRSLGKGTTSLRLDSLTPSSPTSCNTYKNILDAPASAARWEASNTTSQVSQPAFGRLHAGHATQMIPESSDNSDKEQPIPYTLPTYARSILTNGPFSKRNRQASTPSTSSSVSSASSSSPPSSAKRVCFRDPLWEEIQTTQYLLSHSDIPSRSASPAPDAIHDDKAFEAAKTPINSTSPLPKVREVALKVLRPESDEGNNSEDSEESGDSADETSNSPATPVTSRHKKDREWVWTLGPLQGAKGPGSAIDLDPSWEEDLADSLGESVAAATAYSLS